MSVFDYLGFSSNHNQDIKSTPVVNRNQTNRENRKYDTTHLSGFDPTMLERGAKAMKSIKEAGHGDKVLELLSHQETTKQLELQTKASENRKRAAEIEAKNIMMRSQEERRNIQNKCEKERSLAQSRASIETEKQKEIQRMQMQSNQDQLEQQNRMFEKQQEHLRKVEKQRMDNELKIIAEKGKRDVNTAQAREEARSRGNIARERKNAGVHRETLAHEANLRRIESLDIQQARYSFIQSYTNNIFDTITDMRKIQNIILGSTGLFFGFFGCKYGLRVAGRYLETRLGRPSLVRETSRISYLNPLAKFNHSQNRQRYGSESNIHQLFNGLILDKPLRKKLACLSNSTRNAAKWKIPYQSFGFYGPPGTGKTMFCKRLAITSGLDYAIMTAGDFAQLGRDAVTELHKVFDQAEHSKRGTLIFIDEADAFLRKGRGNANTMGEDMRNALSAYLYRTGESSNKFMIILATNLPNTLDCAVKDRIDEFIHFPLPGFSERKEMLRFYIEKNIINVSTQNVDCEKPLHDLNKSELDELFSVLGKQTEGLSGRAISKLVNGLRASAYSGRIEKLDLKNIQITINDLLKSNAAI